MCLYWEAQNVPGVSANKHVSLLAHVYGLLLDDFLQSSDQVSLLCVGHLGGVALPHRRHHLPHGVDQLHPVVLLSRRVSIQTQRQKG